MKNKALFLALSAVFANTAYAEDKPFQFYGILDIAAGHQSNGLPDNTNSGSSVIPTAYVSATNSNGGSHSALWSGGLSQDRIGVKGSKGFDNGFRAGYLAETGFNIVGMKLVNGAKTLVDNSGSSNANAYNITNSSSSQDGQLINREGYVSVGRGQYGDIRYGRNQTLIADAVPAVAPLQNSQVFSLLGNSSSLGGGIGVSETIRMNNSLKYLNNIGKFNVGLMHANDDGKVLTEGGQMNGYSVGFKDAGLNVQLAYSSVTNAVKEGVSTTPGVLAAKIYNSKGWLLGTSYDISSEWTVVAGKSSYTLAAPSSTANAPTSLNGFAVATATAGLTGATTQNVGLTWLGANYKATEKLTIYTTLQQACYSAYSTYTEGHVNWSALMAVYNLDKDTDVYAAVANIKLSNTSSASAISPGATLIGSNAVTGVGVRYKF